jgi:hypothetical protein
VKTALRQPQLAKRYATSIRSIQRYRQRGQIPPPDFWLGPFPLWWLETIEAAERAAALRAPAPKTIGNRAKSDS